MFFSTEQNKKRECKWVTLFLFVDKVALGGKKHKTKSAKGYPVKTISKARANPKGKLVTKCKVIIPHALTKVSNLSTNWKALIIIIIQLTNNQSAKEYTQQFNQWSIERIFLLKHEFAKKDTLLLF